MRFTHELWPSVNLFTDTKYHGFQRVLDLEIKRLHGDGIGVKKRRDEPISIVEKSALWEKGLLGGNTPQKLRYDIVFVWPIFCS